MERSINTRYVSKVLAATLAFATIVMMSFVALEPATAGAQASDTAQVQVNLTVNDEIAITNDDGNSINMGQLGVSSNEATGASSFTVTTNNAAGYQLQVEATSSPAMVGQNVTDEFADYAASSSAPSTWDISDGSGTAQDYAFGFSADGAAADAKWGTGSGCTQGTDIPDTGRSYAGFEGTTKLLVGQTSSSTSGEQTTICFAAAKQGDNGDGAPSSGNYQATVIATATNL